MNPPLNVHPHCSVTHSSAPSPYTDGTLPEPKHNNSYSSPHNTLINTATRKHKNNNNNSTHPYIIQLSPAHGNRSKTIPSNKHTTTANLRIATTTIGSTTSNFWSRYARIRNSQDSDSDDDCSTTSSVSKAAQTTTQLGKSCKHRRRRSYWRKRKTKRSNAATELQDISTNSSSTATPQAIAAQQRLVPNRPIPRTIIPGTSRRQPSFLTPDNQHTNFPYGDPLLQKSPNNYRIISQNINGIRYDAAGGDLQEICQILTDIGADVANFQETKLETRNYQVQQTIRALLTKQWKTSKTFICSTSKIKVNGIHKHGGTMTITNGPISYRVTNKTADEFGRWCTTSVALKNKETLTIISAYQVCQNTVQNAGLSSAYTQQVAMLRLRNDFADPREKFVEDLRILLTKLQQQNHQIIITGDFNEYLSTNTGKLKQLFVDLNLVDPVFLKHGLDNEVATHNRGRRRIDYMFISNALIQYVQSCGYDPFNEHICSDHRLMFLDLDKSLFASELNSIKPPSQRGINGSDTANIQIYVNALHKACTDQNLFTKMKTLQSSNSGNPDLVEKIDSVLGEMMNHADRKCMKRFNEPYSPKLQILRAKKNIIRMRLHELRNGKNMQKQIKKLQRILTVPVSLPTNIATAKTLLCSIHSDLKEATASATEERKKHLTRLSELYQAENKTQESKRLKRIIKAEETKQLFRKLKFLRTKKTNSRLHTIMVPEDPNDDPKTCTQWKTIDDPQEMETLLLQRNQHHFGQAQGTPFASEPLATEVDFSTESASSEIILEGNYSKPELDEIVQHVISNLKAIEKLKSTKYQLTSDDFVNKLKVWNETTSTSPSGRHLGHYMALVKSHGIDPQNDILYAEMEAKRNDLIELHLSIINYCLCHGHSLTRWQSVINVMIEKEPGNPRIHRLRVIHLYEADYNLMLSVKHRDLIHTMNDNKVINDGIYSNRPGFNAIDPVFIEELQNEYNRLTRFSQIKMDVDADSCYDRIVPSLAMLVLRKYGMHQNICIVQGKTLQSVKYKLKTGLGISDNSYQHTIIAPIYGTGQGSSSSPVIWLVILNHLMECHDEKSNGAVYIDQQQQRSIKINVVGFVDDCSCQVNNHGDPTVTTEKLIKMMIQDSQLWRDLLHTSGGELSAGKCTYHFTHYSFTPSGAPCFNNTMSSSPVTIHMKDLPHNITKLSPYTTHKTLGCFKCPSGKNEYKIMKQKSDQLGSAIWGSSCTRREVWTYYFAIYLPSISYSLSVTTFTPSQLQGIQKKATHMFVPMLGYNRNSPLAVIYGPATYGGVGFRSLDCEQGLFQTQMFLKYWRVTSQPGSLLRIVLSWAQFNAGVSWPVLQDTHDSLPHWESQWFNSLRLFLEHTNARIELDNDCISPLQRKNDSYIMDIVLDAQQFTPKQLKYINFCRLYLNVITVSDITQANGTHLDRTMLRGSTSLISSTPRLRGVNQSCPGKRQWSIWRTACRLIANSNGKLYQPLGDWIVNQSDMNRRWKFYYDRHANNLYFQDTVSTHRFQRTDGWRSFNLHDWESSTLPTTATPTSVTITDQIVQATVTANYAIPVHNDIEIFDFEDYPLKYHTWENSLLQQIEFLSPPADIHEKICNGSIICASDGGSSSAMGSFGFIIADEHHNALVKCKGPVFGHCPSSYRSEAFGVLATTRIMYRLISFFGEVESISFTHLMDNQGVIKRMADLLPKVNDIPNDVFISDWDVLQEIKTTLRLMNATIELEHVKSHQDDEVPLRFLSPAARLNVACDTLATDFLQNHAQIYRRSPQFTSTKCHLFIDGITITSQLKSRLRLAHALPPLKHYIQTKQSWTDATWDTINWKAHGSALNRHYHHRQRLVQFIHNKLPTGYEMLKRLPTYDAVCHACHVYVETNDHLLCCPNTDYAMWRSSIAHGLITLCENMSTDPVLLDLLLTGLDSARLDTSVLPSVSSPRYLLLIEAQNIIGWRQLMKGRMCTNWDMVQKEYLSSIGEQSNKLRHDIWSRKIISFIWEKWFDLWTLRNSYHHGKTKHEQKVRKQEKTTREIEFLYSIQAKIQHKNQDLFHESLEDHLAEPLERQILWVKMFRQIILQSKTRLDQTTTEDIRDHFRHNDL